MRNPDSSQIFLDALNDMLPMIEASFWQGYERGLADGQALGFVGAVNELKPALSEGLRAGSSECGKAMRGLRSLGLGNEKKN